MTYTQYRLAKRDGKIVQQSRKLTVETARTYPLWKFWNWGIHDAIYTYGEWEDIPFADANDPN
jgi:hypothetical protein